MADNGTPTSYTLEVVKSMGYAPIAISLLEGEEVFVFKTQAEATLIEEDFSPEGIWVGESELSELDRKKLKKVYSLIEEKEVAPKKECKMTDLPLAYTPYEGSVHVFTGFRDARLTEIIETMGGTVEPRVTSRTTHVVAKNTSTRTVKLQNAIDRGCIVLEVKSLVEELTVHLHKAKKIKYKKSIK